MANSSQRVVVITGCSSGIGLNAAVLLAEDKNFKVIATMRNLQKKEDLEKAAGESLNKSLFIQELDISKEESILKFLKETYSAEGNIDVLINNAGIGQEGPFEDVSLEEMQNMFQANFFGAVRLTQGVVRKMKEQKSGHIIFISSIAGFIGLPFQDFYCASKFAVEGLVNSLAPVLRGFNISVSSIQPGPVATAFVSNLIQKQQKRACKENGPDLDEKTTTMRQGYLSSFEKTYKGAKQSGMDVAKVIKECIDEEKPRTRVQTSLAMMKLAEEVLVDPTGEKDTEHILSLMQ